jgi:hypothetical protein
VRCITYFEQVDDGRNLSDCQAKFTPSISPRRIGPYSDGGYGLIEDRFFSQDAIQPGDTIPLSGPEVRTACCIHPLNEPRETEAAFHVEFVQFVDDSTFGAALLLSESPESNRSEN